MNPFIFINILNLHNIKIPKIIIKKKNIDFFFMDLNESIILTFANVKPVTAIGIISQKYPIDNFIEFL